MIFCFLWNLLIFIMREVKNYHRKIAVPWGACKKIEQKVLFWSRVPQLYSPLCWAVCPTVGLPIYGFVHSLVHWWGRGTTVFFFCVYKGFLSSIVFFLFFFCRARCFSIGLCKIVRTEPGWLCQKKIAKKRPENCLFTGLLLFKLPFRCLQKKGWYKVWTP